MTKHAANYTVESYPPARQLIAEAGRMASRRSLIHGLLEIDVTRARTLLREHKARTGESLSFTAFIVACFAQAVDQDRRVQAYRNWRNQLIVFEEVDVVTPSKPSAAAAGAATLSAQQIANRSRDSTNPLSSTKPARGERRSSLLMRLGPHAPSIFRRMFTSCF
jgi:hypothetical protein